MDDELEIDPDGATLNGPAEQIKRMLNYSLYRRQVLKQSDSCSENDSGEVLDEDEDECVPL